LGIATPIHLHFLRELLSRREHELQEELLAAQQGQRANLQAAETNEVVDRKDEAIRAQLSEVDAAEQRRDLEELASVQRALQRLDQGAFGDCVRCGEPIPLQRLHVQPAAERCAACQAAVERAMLGAP